APGQNFIEIVAFDFSGKNTTKSITVKFDVSAPQVTITNPVSYFITNQDNVDVSYYNNDTDDDFDYYKIYRNGTQIGPDTIQETINVPLPASGLWNITVVAVDETLLEGKSTIFVIRDKQAPVITIDSPNDGDAVSSPTLDVVWSASDALSSMDYYDVYLDGGFYDTTTAKLMEVTLSTDKSYIIKVEAFDIMGNSAFDEITVIRDTVAPTVYFDPVLLPTRDDGYYYTNNPLLSLSWNATDNVLGSGIGQTSIAIDGLLYDTYPPSIISDIIDLGNDSNKEIFITAYDKAGNSANAYIGVILDRAAPSVIINNPENDFTTGLDYIIVSWNSFDAGVGIKEHVILVDGIVEAALTDLGISFYQIDFTIEKTYLITVRAIDLLDYSFEYSINVTYDHNAPTISVTLPTSMTSYINETTTTIDWAINGLLVDYFEISINGTSFNTYSNTTFSALITLDPGLYELPAFFVNVSAITLTAQVYSAFRWIYIDQIDPLVGFNTPPTTQLTENMHIEWFGIDDGSGIGYFELSLNTTTLIKDKTSTSHVFDVSGLNGIYELTIVAYDIAGNSNFETVYVDIFLYAPIYETSIGSLIICNDLNIQFNLSVTDPGIGIDLISVIVDNTNEVFGGSYGSESITEVFGRSYDSESITEPFWILINVTDDQYLIGLIAHNITITIVDKVSRESIETINIILDTDDPKFWQEPIFDTTRLNDQSNEVTLTDDNNNHSITIYIEEIHQLENVTVTLTGDGYNETFFMILNTDTSTSTVKVYEKTIDFSALEAGDYSLTFNFTDEAGNSNSESYTLELIPTIVDPGSSIPYLYVIIGVAVAVIIGFIVAIALRRPVSNQGWEEEIIVVAYILKSGLTALFVPYSVEIATDEQLFGGAMSGIRSILEEIIGKKKRFEVETVEFGDKHLLIYSGLYGDSIALVRSIKPIHSRLLNKFADEFEDGYGECLDDDRHVTVDDYYGAENLVEKFFGKRTPLDAAAYQIDKLRPEEYRKRIADKPVETGKDAIISSFYHEILDNHEAFDQLTGSTKVQIGDAIIFAEESLTDLIAEDYKNAEKKANNALKSLQLARRSIGTISHFQSIFNTIPKIVELVLFGVMNGQKGNTEDYYKAIELASQLFLSQIT
ncbi:MAG: Ig-like domain-containing protein, partial [Candidatus Heimdallarchaeota archaeon]